jgi:uncharacterized RDD family membrane protein YckC
MLDECMPTRRTDPWNSTERANDVRFVAFLIAVAAIPILWVAKTYLGFGQQAFKYAAEAAVL